MNPSPTAWRSRPGECRIRQVAERYQRADTNSARATDMPSRRRSGECLSGLGFRQGRLEEAAPRSFPAAGRCVSHWPNCCCKSRTCCCSTSPPTIWTWKRATGWRSTQTYPYAFVLVSHDRYFLDVTVRKIAELWNKRLHFYTGGYSRYEELKDGAPHPTAGGLRESAGPHPATGSIHHPLPLPGHQGQAGAEPHQGTGEDREDRDSARRKEHSLQVSAAETERPHRGRIQGCCQELRRARVFSQMSIS